MIKWLSISWLEGRECTKGNLSHFSKYKYFDLGILLYSTQNFNSSFVIVG